MRIIKTSSALFIFLFSFLFEISAQLKIDSGLYLLFQRTDTLVQKFNKPLKESNNEFNALMSSFFLVYKSVISSQDKPRCVFYPSCSEYAVEAFRKKGIIVGWLMTFDRLSRCHGMAGPDYYRFDATKKRFYDPVQ